jgi:hypothetical protein
VLRVIREILFYEPKRRGTSVSNALEFLSRVTRHRAIVVLISDFMDQTRPAKPTPGAKGQRAPVVSESFALAASLALRQANRRHDLVTVQITDRFELELPLLGRLVLKDAETGEVLEINTSDPEKRRAFTDRQLKAQADLQRLFRSLAIDSIQLQTDLPYASALGRFFETREKRRRHG